MAGIPFELKGKTVFVAGHGGMVGGALVRRLAQEDVELLTAARSEVDLRDQAAVFGWFADKRPQAVFLAAAKVGGIVANNTLRGEFHLRQPDHRGQRDPRRPRQWRGEADVSWLVLHLSQAGAAAAARGFRADGTAGADQRALCDRQDRRHQDGRGLSQPVRLRLHQRDADQSVRARRQLSSRIQPRRRRADPPVSRSEGLRRRRCRGLGHRHAAAGIPLCRRSCRCLHSSDEELFRATNWSISAPARTSPSPNSPAWSPPPSAMPARSASTPRGPTARRANCSMSAASPGWAGAPRTSLEDGIKLAYQAYLAEHHH